MSQEQARPVEIRPHTKSKVLEIEWNDGHVSKYTYEYLRVECPCADCKGHTPDQAKSITGKENVDINSFDPVGNYAIQLSFDDGHNTGIFTWDYLRRLDTAPED
ncbi:MAG TPA: DUF971 domain-containing protein [Gammaproteobacteria bacterium]|nr:DUF971 domain-containing protein [Gammaproteobacteria bacterium]